MGAAGNLGRFTSPRGWAAGRDAVHLVASTLNVTRFTIYNYLNEIADEQADESASAVTGDTAPGKEN